MRDVLGRLGVLLCVGAMAASCSRGTSPGSGPDRHEFERASAFLRQQLDSHSELDVYTDAGAAGDHFPVAVVDGTGSTFVLDDASDPHQGATSIAATWDGQGEGGGGLLMLGRVDVAGRAPEPNWGEVPAGGYDLSAATKLTFWARGARGGERVEFFALGLGRDAHSGAPVAPYPDSDARWTRCGRLVSPCLTTLTRSWQEVTIDLAGAAKSSVAAGLGWWVDGASNGNAPVSFWLDDAHFDVRVPSGPRLLRSWEPRPALGADVDTAAATSAYTYDNALALVAFLLAGDTGSAKQVADAFVYAQRHDRTYHDGRLRDAYQAGAVASPPAWRPGGVEGSARLPLYWDPGTKSLREPGGASGSSAGNMAWAMIALLAYYDQVGGREYRDAAAAIGTFVEEHYRDTRGDGGYVLGYSGADGEQELRRQKATENNLDLFVAFSRLATATHDEAWERRAGWARRFVTSMWDAKGGHFWGGTGADGVLVAKRPVPLDAQVWGVLALGEAPTKPLPARDVKRLLAYTLDEFSTSVDGWRGFSFSSVGGPPWFEGTAQAVCALAAGGERAKATSYLSELKRAQDAAPNTDGRGLVATVGKMATGYGDYYYDRLHAGATAWYMFALRSYDPFWGRRVG